MSKQVLTLLLLVVLPEVATSGISAAYLFPEWTVLTASYQQYEKLATSPTVSLRDLDIAHAAEMRHRINCFAEGVGVLMGGAIAAIGIHGICTLKR
jgi:hypothetical protein